MASAALDHLKRLAGPDAEFRPGQLEAIEHLVRDRRRVLCVQRTGWGKSAVYFVATALLRERGSGPTLLVSPLLALMRNQVLAAEALAREAPTAFMCAEAPWWRCHRRLVADALTVRGWTVSHIGPDGRLTEHALPDFAVVEGARITYPPPQLTL